MKTVTVTELKSHLSKYLRLASRGTRIVVKDRDDPIAQIGPLEAEPLAWHDRLAREGRLRLGSQEWETFQVSKLKHATDIQSSLRAVREEAHEIRRR
jgi:antitoxin (DNA-binding transcriptional repressor) of toxin-antitoxin stability system